MPGNPQAKIKHIGNLVEWHTELAAVFDKALPRIYRFNGVASTGDRRRDAWANANHIVMTGAALTELEAVLRSAAIQRAEPRGRPSVYVKIEPDAGPDKSIGTPMYADE